MLKKELVLKTKTVVAKKQKTDVQNSNKLHIIF